MGLDTTHNCFHGAYSAFMRWREKLAEVAGIPLHMMEGYYHPDMMVPPSLKSLAGFLKAGGLDFVANAALKYHDYLPLRWELLRPDPALYFLLIHSDCEGDIPVEMLIPLAERLTELLPLLGDASAWDAGLFRDVTQKFIDGLRLAASLGEPVEFH